MDEFAATGGRHHASILDVQRGVFAVLAAVNDRQAVAAGALVEHERAIREFELHDSVFLVHRADRVVLGVDDVGHGLDIGAFRMVEDGFGEKALFKVADRLVAMRAVLFEQAGLMLAHPAGDFLDGFIERRQGFQVNVANNLELSQTHYMLLQQATQEIDQSAAGREVEGRSNSSSGREFQLRQQQATQPIRKLFSNLRAARRRVALYLLDEILREFPDLQTTKYDIVIEEAPESLNLNAETFETLVQLANNSKVPVPLDMLIKVSPLSGTIKKEFIERLQQQEQQQQALMAQQQEMMMQQQAAKAAGQ